jgi:asparagine synthase (glutamine-hydrolysing)
VARFLGSSHTHFVVSKEEMLASIPEVIRAIGSYDTTTVRASVGNYLVCKKIREKGECTYLFNGDGADELMGGYLYMKEAPSAHLFDLECKRLLTHIHSFDVLRSDRSIAGNGLAPRTPYLDFQFVRTYLTIPSTIRYQAH